MSLGLYQFGNKYRDELRTRGGLARAKEFIMKDAYSFNATESGSRAAYESVREAYLRVFRRLGLDAVVKSSDNGEIGGQSSEEFHVLSDLGEDEIDGQKALECAHFRSGRSLFEGSRACECQRQIRQNGLFWRGHFSARNASA
jgi:prolyl-tRNA synthetase